MPTSETSPTVVLLVEDSDDDAFLIERALDRVGEGSFALTRARSVEEAGRELARSKFHVCLLDLTLPDSHGLEALSELQSHATAPPVVVLTGNSDEALAMGALREGAQDYLVKGQVEGRGLLRAIRYAIERHRRRELERANAELHQEVRAKQLAHDELARVAAELERSNRELASFATVASHDLQEPLRKVTMFASRVRAQLDPTADAQSRDDLERMSNAAARMQALIDDLLELSRVLTRAQPFVRVDLAAVTAEVLADLDAVIDEKQARIHIGTLPVVRGDATQIQQLMQNLLGNALKFAREQAAPQITVDAVPVGQPEAPGGPASTPTSGWVCINVSDNGIGFEDRYLQRMFSPFQRLHSKDSYPGSGMGLAICQRIAERHGGSITASGQPGHGAEFRVVLPLA